MTTRSVLDHSLLEIRDDILRLASLVNQATRRAMEAFATGDVGIAQEVIEGDNAIDSLHHSLEEHIVRTTALQQPIATDLRVLIAALLITNELERMGDHAEGIARTVSRREEHSPVDVPPALSEMREWTCRMIQAAADAFASGNVDEAKEVARLDDQLDVLYQQFFQTTVEEMTHGQLPGDRGTYLLWAGHNLERIGDRVTNICERIVYARTGLMGGLNPKAGAID